MSPRQPSHQTRAKLHRFACMLAAERFLIAGRRLSAHLRKYDPSQPRVPAGRPDAGQWTRVSEGGGGGGFSLPLFDAFTDVSGEDAWGDVSSSYTDTGELASEQVSNSDGSSILSEFATGDAILAWDERHTVVTTSGNAIRFENTGDTQTITDVATGQTIARNTWTPNGVVPEPTLQSVFVPSTWPFIVQTALEAGTILFTWLSSHNSSQSTTIFDFKASEFAPNPSGEVDKPAIWIGTRTKEEVDALCPRREEVQQMTDAAVAAVRDRGLTLTPQQFGTAVHKELQDQIKALRDPNFRAEVSFIKSELESYGTPGSIRVDVYEKAPKETVCVYDIKTGKSGFTLPRMQEVATNVQYNYGPQRIILTEIRPAR